MTDLPEGHPLPWNELVVYEKQQGGYWLYGPHCDVYGNGKIWVPVRNPEWGAPEPGFEKSDAFLSGYLQGLAEGRRERGGRNADGTIKDPS